MYRERGRDHHPAVDELAQLVDLFGVIAAVGHGDDRDRSARLLDPPPDRAGGSLPVPVAHGLHPGVLLGVLLEEGEGRIAGVVVDREELTGQVDPAEDAVEAGHDRLALLVHGDHDRDGERRHPRTSALGRQGPRQRSQSPQQNSGRLPVDAGINTYETRS